MCNREEFPVTDSRSRELRSSSVIGTLPSLGVNCPLPDADRMNHIRPTAIDPQQNWPPPLTLNGHPLSPIIPAALIYQAPGLVSTISRVALAAGTRFCETIRQRMFPHFINIGGDMNNELLPSRRNFLRAALAAPVAGAMVGGLFARRSAGPTPGRRVLRGDARQLDKDLYDVGHGCEWPSAIPRFPPNGPVLVRWLDSFGRVAGERELPASKSGVARQSFDFQLDPGFTYRNWIRVWVNGVEQTEGAHFMFSPAPKPWDDFHVISWAHYPDGFYDLLRKVGVDATIAYKEATDPVLDNNFNFYVEQLMWEVFAIYHKDQPLWRGLLNQVDARPQQHGLVGAQAVHQRSQDRRVRQRPPDALRAHSPRLPAAVLQHRR